MPIPQPQGYKAVDGYKIAFSVAGAGLHPHGMPKACMRDDRRVYVQMPQLLQRPFARLPDTCTCGSRAARWHSGGETRKLFTMRHCTTHIGDRLYTAWLRVVGGNAPGVPMVDLTLTRMGNDIKSVAAQVHIW